ncbi:NADP-dependent oxidoreductase domain-containing protein [Microdochium trichocladiopsis]|uniref:NADP-dependent oxidoreductase domain-containing protein n=1 Tax=Microdochium trichocladiopsis TaxID=1682393 RepID=A0A9P9BKZ4_9PEZI|nr:NADP-dependent oxidoreductase domain-containing protein [Microdochium trichocladiopsis]KAH7024369.1 NADP-dependent oxidoreductase domain-containing protein [Microdochium trichocladiopsis]
MAGSTTGYLSGLFSAAPKTSISYNRLGKSGLKISKVVLGAMSFGHKDWRDWVLEEAEALPLLEHAWKCGINTWDTADLYSNGVSEEIIAKAISTYKIPRESVVLMTKCRWATSGPGEPQMSVFDATSNDGRLVNRLGLSRKHIFDAVQASVKRLGTYIDVLQIQRMDPEVPREEIMKALNDVVEAGWVRYIGASSMPAWEFQALQNIAKEHGWHQFVSMQNYYNLLYREEEREMMPYCRDAGVGCIPWSPLARGVLSRPWNALREGHESIRAASDVTIRHLVNSSDEGNPDKNVVDTLEQVAKARGLPMAVIATAWCIAKGVNPIVGLNSIARIDEAVLAANTVLTDEEIALLDSGYRPKAVTGY